MTRASAWRGAAVAALALSLAGCSSFESRMLNPLNWFGPEPVKPTPLEAFTPKLAVRQAWSARVDSVQFPLQPAVVNGSVAVAGTDGNVMALDAASGRQLWHANIGSRLSAGVGSDGRFAAVVTRDNDLVVLEQGNEKWRKRLATRVTTAPLVAGERVFVLGVDRGVRAFDALDGSALWAVQRPSEALTLSVASVIAPYRDTLLVAQGARLAGLDPLNGNVRWEVALATPRGTNEVERLADLVGPVVRVGSTVCARAFQSAVGCADAERGVLQWSRNVGGVNAVAGDEQLLVGADASDRVGAWRTASGEPAWSHDKLLHRHLSAPALLERAAVYGDFEGQVHFLSRTDGSTLNRLPTDGSPVVATVRAGSTVLVATRSGGLFAFQAE